MVLTEHNIAADGSYTYAATTAAADALGNGDRVTDVFTYTVTDENSATSTAVTILLLANPSLGPLMTQMPLMQEKPLLLATAMMKM